MTRTLFLTILGAILATGFISARAEGLGNYQSHTPRGRSVLVTGLKTGNSRSIH